MLRGFQPSLGGVVKNSTTWLRRATRTPNRLEALFAPRCAIAPYLFTGMLLAGIFIGLSQPAHASQIFSLVADGNGIISEYAAQAGPALTMPESSESSFTPASGPTPNLGAFTIVIVPGPGLAANAPALLAFQRAANQWQMRISDPITVTINADLAPLGPGIIGSANSVTLQSNYTTIRNQMVADAAPDVDDTIVASLPTAGGFSATLPAGFGTNGNLSASKANLKAMGFTGLDVGFGVSDAAITFSSTFAFDYDNSNGVGPGLIDFETVAAHELGHALGFISVVDTVDFLLNAGQTSSAIQPFPLDLFRFSSANNPANAAQFNTFPRNLTPGAAGFFDDTANEYLFSTGQFTGDGRQASHWKDNNLTGTLLGVMDPTLATQQIFTITDADWRAFDVIGYDIAPFATALIIPEPSTLSLASLMLLGTGVIGWRRKCRARS